MIEWRDLYKVVVAMMPLYTTLGLGYVSVKRWHMFKPDACDAINRFNCFFIIPFFNFHFMSTIDPYHISYRFLSADVIAKIIVCTALTLWAKFYREGSFSWVVTSYSLSSITNALIVGVALLEAMYGQLGKDLVVQSSIIQSLIWLSILLFLLEFRCTAKSFRNEDAGGQLKEIVCKNGEMEDDQTNKNSGGVMLERATTLYDLSSTVKKVLGKLARNPNSYACTLGVIWAVFSKRWNFEMPSIMEGSILIMAKAGSAVAMFTMGLFMALQEKLIECGVKLTIYSMVLRFVMGPLTMAIGSLALGLSSNVLKIAIVQAALPPATVTFVFAQQYGLHANVLSTAVFFGTIASLPVMLGYYVLLDICF